MSDELEPIGISLILDDGVAESLRRLGRDMQVFGRQADVTTAHMRRVAALHLGSYRQPDPGRIHAAVAPMTAAEARQPRRIQSPEVGPAPAPRSPMRPAMPHAQSGQPVPVTSARLYDAARPPPRQIVSAAQSPTAGDAPTNKPPPVPPASTQWQRPHPVADRPHAAQPTPSTTLTAVKPPPNPPAETAQQRPKIHITLSRASPADVPHSQNLAATTTPARGPTARIEQAWTPAPNTTPEMPPTPMGRSASTRPTQLAKPARLPAAPSRALPPPTPPPDTPAVPRHRLLATSDLASLSPKPPTDTAAVPPPSRAAAAPAPKAAVLLVPPTRSSAGPRASFPLPPNAPSAPATNTAPASAAAASQGPGQSAASGPIPGDLWLDGISIGSWLSTTMAREAARPPTAARGFNTRMSPAWPGIPL